MKSTHEEKAPDDKPLKAEPPDMNQAANYSPSADSASLDQPALPSTAGSNGAPVSSRALHLPSLGRRIPSRMQTIGLFLRSDLASMSRSWLCRGFLLVSALITVLALKGMQSEQKPASQMLEAVYSTYLLVWMHAVIFIAGSALMREMDCLNDAILCRGVTRGEYITGKLTSRCLGTFLMIAGILLPASFWAIRQDKLVRTQEGFVTSAARNTRVEAWEPKKIFAEVGGPIKEMTLQLGDFVQPGAVLAQLDDRAIFDELENERRAEENARNEVNNARRRVEEARRNVAQAQDALERADRGLIGKDLLSKAEQADRMTDIRSRKRDLRNAESQLRITEEAVPTAERAVENALARVRDARRRLAHTTITAPLGGYVTEILAHPAQFAPVGTHLLTISPLDDYKVRVPIYSFDEFKRLKTNMTAYIKVEQTEYKGAVERLSPMTQADRWGRDSNMAIVRFKGDGTLGLLGLHAHVRLVLPPPTPERTNRVTAIFHILTGRAGGESVTRTTSVTVGWMFIGLGKVLGCALLLTTLTLTMVLLFRNALVAILGAAGLWHVSNLVFDFAGLKEVSYLEMISSMDQVLGGIARPMDELIILAWIFGLAAVFGLLAVTLFISRDPAK